jgi:hypothetical protein
MDREQIYQSVIEFANRHVAFSPQEDHRWGSLLAKCKPVEVFWGLILVFQRSKSTQHQEIAGYLLDKMRPRLRLDYLVDLGEVLLSVIDNWNVSVEQLPVHLSRVYGKEAFLQELSIMSKESLPEGSLRYRKIETMGWWLTGWTGLRLDD